MIQTTSSVLTAWSSFYIMTSSSAAALTGLMFVVITLVTGTERSRPSHDGISTFSTPTVVHFCAALFVSAILSAPWGSLVGPAALLGLASLSGLVYVSRLMHRTKRLTAYNPDLDDWIWYTILPFLGYGATLAGAIMLLTIAVKALFVLAGGVLLLIFIGIHNAWDIVTFLAVGGADDPQSTNQNDEPAQEK
jgi:hypothetical protein